MAITITAPAPAVPDPFYDSPEDDQFDPDGDIRMAKRPRPSSTSTTTTEIVTPGETITEDPQWMR
jgi:exosome complex component RRP4